MERGRSKDPGKQERLDNYKAQFKNGKKKWIRYDEGAILYSMGIHSFMDLANEAKAVYRIKRICLVNTEKLDLSDLAGQCYLDGQGNRKEKLCTIGLKTKITPRLHLLR